MFVHYSQPSPFFTTTAPRTTLAATLPASQLGIDNTHAKRPVEPMEPRQPGAHENVAKNMIVGGRVEQGPGR